MEVALPSDKKEEESQPTEHMEEETEKQARQSAKMLTPMYIKPIEWVDSDNITLLLQDEFKQTWGRFLVSRSTLRELNIDLNDIFKEGGEQ